MKKWVKDLIQVLLFAIFITIIEVAMNWKIPTLDLILICFTTFITIDIIKSFNNRER